MIIELSDEERIIIRIALTSLEYSYSNRELHDKADAVYDLNMRFVNEAGGNYTCPKCGLVSDKPLDGFNPRHLFWFLTNRLPKDSNA